MAQETYLISDGVTYYLSGLNAPPYNGSGTPWTAQSTSPYELAMNDKGGRYTPQIAQAIAQYGGGPPFRMGQSLAYKGYANVIEPVGIQMRGTNSDNCIALKQQLARILNTSQVSLPCILAIKPDGSSNVAYYEIYHADVQESTDFLNDEAGNGLLRATATWNRSPFAGQLSAGETALASAAINNTGTGSPDNVEALTTNLSGDLVNEGQPLNVIFTPTTASRVVQLVYLATIHSRTYTATGAATQTTSSTATINGTAIPFDASAAITRTALKPRAMVQFTTLSAAAEVRLRVAYKNGVDFFIGQWRRPQDGNAATSNVVADLGSWPLPAGRRAAALAALNYDLYIDLRSTDGTSVTGTFSFTELLLCYTFCMIKTLFASLATQDGLPNSAYLLIDCFQEQTGYPCLPHPNPMAWRVESSGVQFRIPYVIIGTPPRYYNGASLYACWTAAADAFTLPTRATANAATLAARQAPLWRSFRGND